MTTKKPAKPKEKSTREILRHAGVTLERVLFLGDLKVEMKPGYYGTDFTFYCAHLNTSGKKEWYKLRSISESAASDLGKTLQHLAKLLK